jgi:hypothetical protein
LLPRRARTATLRQQMSTVYKYCCSRGVAILENRELKITPPNRFNDPFEFTPRMIWSNTLGRATSILMDKKQVKTLYEKEKAMGQFNGTFRKFQHYINAHRPKIAKELSRCIPLAAVQVRQELLD